MDTETYSAYLFTALNRANIAELKHIWRLSLVEKSGATVRDLITKKLQEIAQSNRLEATATLEELYATYKVRKMQRRIRHMPLTWIKYYLEKENLSALTYALDNKLGAIRDDEIFIDEICITVGNKSLDFVKEYLALNTKLQNYPEYTLAYVFKSAILHRNVSAVQYLFAQKESFTDETYESIMEAGAETGDWDWIAVAMEKAEPSGETLKHAAKGGHEDVIQFFVKKLDSPHGNSCLLQGYVLAQNILKVKELLSKYVDGAEQMEYALYRALDVENKTIISLVLSKMGAIALTVWRQALDIAAQGSIKTLRYFYSRRKKWSTDDLLDSLAMAVYYERLDNIHFLLEKGANPAELTEETLIDMKHLLVGEDEL